jgi:modulator of FtsH protease
MSENAPVIADASGWQNFYLMVGGAAAALTGLIFVAVSLHTRSIMGNELYRDRAWASVASLISQVFVAGAILVPTQPAVALGIEIELVALFWVYRTVWVIRQFGPSMRTADRPSSRWQLEWIEWLIWLAALLAGGLVVIFESEVGFDLLAIAMVGMFLSAVWNAWVLISEVAD